VREGISSKDFPHRQQVAHIDLVCGRILEELKNFGRRIDGKVERVLPVIVTRRSLVSEIDFWTPTAILPNVCLPNYLLVT